jgi:hypothetical protein
MTYQSALNKLAALSIGGVQHNYAINALPALLSRAQLPALLVLPIDTLEQNPFRRAGGEGFQTVAFNNGARTVTYSVTHLLLVAPAEQAGGLRSLLPTLVSLVDAYFAALGANITLDGDLLEPPHVRVEPGLFEYGGLRCAGVAFRHTWLLEV